MSNPSTATVVNDLMNGELRAAHLYWQAGAWCVERNLDGCSELLLSHADEELTHMKKMLGYLVDCEWPIHFQALPEPKVETESVQDLFQIILDHEKKVTDGINAAVKAAQAADDHSTFEFLQWFVMEQREEIKTFQSIIDRIKLIGDGPHSLYYIDKEVAEISAAMAAASGGGGSTAA
ncbi:MAG: ferritin [Pseudomonadota bacterium]